MLLKGERLNLGLIIKETRDYFRKTRRLLKSGQADFVLDDINAAL